MHVFSSLHKHVTLQLNGAHRWSLVTTVRLRTGVQPGVQRQPIVEFHILTRHSKSYRGQLFYKGQSVWSQGILYKEVPLYNVHTVIYTLHTYLGKRAIIGVIRRTNQNLLSVDNS